MNEDWWFKIRRAEKHMVDIKQEALKYAGSKPYSLTRIRLRDSQNEIRYRFRITEQPNPIVAVMLGDFIHNLRSALDYIVVACVPKQRRSKAGFPILFQDIFAKDEDGQFVVNDSCLRKNFETATKGLHPDAKALIIDLQPYWGESVIVGGSSIHILGVISRLENANKHRQLITIGCGGREFYIDFTVRGFTEPIRYQQVLATGTNFLKDNTIIPFLLPPDFSNIKFPDGTRVKPSDVNMHLTGTAKILIKVPRIGGNQPSADFLLDSFIENALNEVQTIISKLEPFVIKI